MTAGAPLLKKMAQNLYAKADRLLKLQEENGYLLAMKPQDFIWGSNMVVTNRADLLITAALFEQRQLDMDDAGVSLDETALIKVIEYSIVNAKQPVRMSKEERKERLQSIADAAAASGLFGLAQKWANNEIHSYQFTHQAAAIVLKAMLTAAQAQKGHQ